MSEGDNERKARVVSLDAFRKDPKGERIRMLEEKIEEAQVTLRECVARREEVDALCTELRTRIKRMSAEGKDSWMDRHDIAFHERRLITEEGKGRQRMREEQIAKKHLDDLTKRLGALHNDPS